MLLPSGSVWFREAPCGSFGDIRGQFGDSLHYFGAHEIPAFEATNQKVGSSNLSGRTTSLRSGPDTWVTQRT
jgi:hypothetical protein